MVDQVDHVTGVTGLSPTGTVSRNGTSFNGVTGTIASLGSGLYKLTPSIFDTLLVGPAIFHFTAAGVDPVDIFLDIVNYDPFQDMLPPTAAQNADATLDELTTGHSIANSLSQVIKDIDTDGTANKVTTDKFVFSETGDVDANIVRVGGVGGDVITDVSQVKADISSVSVTNTIGSIAIPSLIELGDPMELMIQCVDPNTGAPSDATGSPTFRVYEADTDVAIQNGTLAIAETAAVDGLYSVELLLTSGLGYETNKSYIVRCQAVVSGQTGAAIAAFRIGCIEGMLTGLRIDKPLTDVVEIKDAAGSGVVRTLTTVNDGTKTTQTPT